MLDTKEKINKWLREYGIPYYTIRDDLTVDVSVGINLSGKRLTEIPIQFGIIDGDFWCENNALISLKGCPIEVRGDFYCSHNKLTNFEYSPKLVEGNYICGHNLLKSINDLECQIYGEFIHSCYFSEPLKLIELKNYYKESQKHMLAMRISGKELASIICERYLHENLHTNNIVQKKNKL